MSAGSWVLQFITFSLASTVCTRQNRGFAKREESGSSGEILEKDAFAGKLGLCFKNRAATVSVENSPTLIPGYDNDCLSENLD